MSAKEVIAQIDALPPAERQLVIEHVHRLTEAAVPDHFRRSIADALAGKRGRHGGRTDRSATLAQVKYKYRATEPFWESFYDLPNSQKESVRRTWKIFKKNHSRGPDRI